MFSREYIKKYYNNHVIWFSTAEISETAIFQFHFMITYINRDEYSYFQGNIIDCGRRKELTIVCTQSTASRNKN